MAKAKPTEKVTDALRNGWLAYLGIYGAAFERLQPQLEKLGINTETMFEELVAKGEVVESGAQERMEDARSKAHKLYEQRVSKLRGAMAKTGNDNAEVSELQEEIESLNKQIASLKRKVTSIDKAVKAA